MCVYKTKSKFHSSIRALMSFHSARAPGPQYLFDYAVARGLSFLRPAVQAPEENQLLKASVAAMVG